MNAVKKSPWILHYDGSSCNGCDIEVLACLTPMYDVERFGIINTGNPKHADILLITGSVNEQNIPVIKQLYEQMPNPKAVVAVGACAGSGGVFRECYNVQGGVSEVIPVDVFVPGCAARPESIINGVVLALEKLGRRMETKWRDIDKIALLNETHHMKVDGWRLAQICAVKAEDAGEVSGFTLLYTFVKDLKAVQLRLFAENGGEVESVSWLYEYAFLYENEIRDLFGVNIVKMNLDFKGHLYKTAVKTPFGASATGGTEAAK